MLPSMSPATEMAPLLDRLRPVRMAVQPLGPSPFDYRPYRYSQSPLRLFFEDAVTFGTVLWTIADLALPIGGKDVGDIELVNTWRARRDDFLIVGVSIAQAVFLPVTLFGAFFLPGLGAVLWMFSLFFATSLILWTVQGPRLVHSKVDLEGDGTRVEASHAGEKWIFINGVMVGNIGLQNAVDGIARVFKRPVLGIHNETQGFLGDVFECLMQRCFAYSTKDVRSAYQEVYNHITKPEILKVVLIAHSQGAIIASLVLDRLYVELPEEIVGKLEIYTFGSAASHFNNPSHLQNFTSDDLNASPVGGLLDHQRSRLNSPLAASSELESPSSSETIHHPPTACPNHVITTIEHYANESDPIPRWGVLHASGALLDTRYSGNVFVRMGASGHFFTSHYLASWFPMDAETAFLTQNQLVEFEGGRVEESTEYVPPPWRESMLEEATRMQWGDGKYTTKEDLERLERARRRLREGQFYAMPDHARKMRNISRLWQYVDGGSPPVKPSVLKYQDTQHYR